MKYTTASIKKWPEVPRYESHQEEHSGFFMVFCGFALSASDSYIIVVRFLLNFTHNVMGAPVGTEHAYPSCAPNVILIFL